MPLQKTSTILLVVLWFNLFLFTQHVAATNMENCFRHLSSNDPQAEEAFFAATDSFGQMISYLDSSNYLGGYFILSEGKDEEEVCNYLQQAGFESTMALRIINTYLFGVNSDGMAVIPTDSLPYIKPHDYSQIHYYVWDDDYLIFRLHFYDCYQIGDRYDLFIAVKYFENRWLVCEWRLYEV